MSDKISLLVLVLLSTAACGPGQKPQTGAAYYRALNCRVCHRIGEDGGRGGPDLSLVGLRHSREWLDIYLKDPQAWNNKTLMPNPRLSSSARAALVEYLSGLKGQAFATQKPWNDPKLQGDPVSAGLVLYARAGCISCHGKGGAGGYPNNNVPGGLIPALDKTSESYNKEELIKKIAKGSIPIKADSGGPAPLVSMPAWEKILGPTEMELVARYLLSLKPRTPALGEADW